MSDSTNGDTPVQGTFRLMYRSHSLIPAGDDATALGDIFTTARRRNRELDITGALMVAGDAFVQALEGEEGAVRELYAHICRDPRHDEVVVLEEGPVAIRSFGRWAMAKVAEGGGPDIRLLSNANRGRIVAAPGRDTTITDDQRAVLARMREAVTGRRFEIPEAAQAG